MLGQRNPLTIGFSEEYDLNSPRFSYLYDLFVQSEKTKLHAKLVAGRLIDTNRLLRHAKEISKFSSCFIIFAIFIIKKIHKLAFLIKKIYIYH